jgi:hypothetical protein
MSMEGVVQNGVAVLTNGQRLEDGSRVKVIVERQANPASPNSTLGSLLELAGIADDLPSDMARNHDHYIHGTPKR